MRNLLDIKNINCHSELDSESINLINNKELALIDSGSESGMTGANKSNNRTGFTLAEVLITLGIIGVVAAMTIPNLISGYQKKATVAKLQKAISTLNQAYKLSYDEFGDPGLTDMNSQEYFKQYWAPFIRVLTYCTSYSVCGFTEHNPYLTPSGAKSTLTVVAEPLRTTFYTSDGFLYVILIAAGGITTDYRLENSVFVDINGSEKPNRICRDVFKLERVQDKGVLPYGYNMTDSDVKTGLTNDIWDNTCA